MRPLLALAMAGGCLAGLSGGPALAASSTSATAIETLPGPAPARTPPPAERRPPSAFRPAMRLFLSPDGEPFRPTPQAPDPLKTWFDQADTGHLGYLDRAEFRADAARFFRVLDTNHDGIIDGFEVTAYETKMVPELTEEAEGRFLGGPSRSDRQGGGAQRSGHGRGAAGGQGGGQGDAKARGGFRNGIAQLIDEPEPVTGADFNFDSRITMDEWMRAADQRFDILDAAKTGRLTLDELRARLKPAGKGR